jgi:hypothetical protein
MTYVLANHTTSSNDACRMPNVEGMTKHESSDESDDSFWFEEQPKTMTEDKRNRNAESGITAQEPCVSRRWSFGIDSLFGIRHSSLQS